MREIVAHTTEGSHARDPARRPCITMRSSAGNATALPHSGTDGPIQSRNRRASAAMAIVARRRGRGSPGNVSVRSAWSSSERASGTLAESASIVKRPAVRRTRAGGGAGGGGATKARQTARRSSETQTERIGRSPRPKAPRTLGLTPFRPGRAPRRSACPCTQLFDACAAARRGACSRRPRAGTAPQLVVRLEETTARARLRSRGKSARRRAVALEVEEGGKVGVQVARVTIGESHATGFDRLVSRPCGGRRSKVARASAFAARASAPSEARSASRTYRSAS